MTDLHYHDESTTWDERHRQAVADHAHRTGTNRPPWHTPHPTRRAALLRETAAYVRQEAEHDPRLHGLANRLTGLAEQIEREDDR